METCVLPRGMVSNRPWFKMTRNIHLVKFKVIVNNAFHSLVHKLKTTTVKPNSFYCRNTLKKAFSVMEKTIKTSFPSMATLWKAQKILWTPLESQNDTLNWINNKWIKWNNKLNNNWMNNFDVKDYNFQNLIDVDFI